MNVGERSAVVWRGLVSVFGKNFTTVYGLDPSPIWISALAELTDEQCRAGVVAMHERSNKTMPVNLTEFVAACREAVPDQRRARAAQAPRGASRYPPPPSNDYPTAPVHVIDDYLARMRATLAGGNQRSRAPVLEREPGTGPGEG